MSGNDDIDAFFDAAVAEAGEGSDSDLDFDGFSGADIQGGDDEDDVDTETDDDGDGEAPADDDSDDTDDGATDEPEDFDWAEYADKKVKIKVAGQDVQITLAEAIQNGMRQADYTRKTQELSEAVKMAQWAQQLREAFQRDPRGTIGFLQQAYQVGNDQEVDEFEDVDPEFRPFAEKLSKIEQENARLRQAMAERQEAAEQERVLGEIKAEMSALEAEFDDFDPFEILPVARDTGLNLRDAYHLVSAKKSADARRSQSEARKQAEAKAEAEAAKRALAKKVTPARSPRGTADDAVDFDSFEQLLEHNLKASRR